MSTWQRSSTLDIALTLATVTLVTSLCLTMGVTGCPQPCQCTQTYYVYCQKMGLTSENVLGVVTSVPTEALLLDLSSNALDRLSSGVLDSVPNLEYLFLADNQLHSLGLSVFHYQRKLRELSLRENRLKEVGGGVFVNMSTLRKLHLDSNGIEQIHARAFSLPQLRQLSLQKNRLARLASLQLSGLASLQVLDLSDNQLQAVEVGAFRDLPALQVLRLSRNRLSSLAENVFQGLASLKELYLDGNLLPSLDCFQVPNLASTLQVLVLSNNSLVAVARDVFPRLRSVRVLTLDHNRISFVGGQAFKDLQLDNLTLAHNLLDAVDRDMLEGPGRISKLDLSHNRIHTLRTGAFDSFRESVYVLDLAGNRITTLDHGMLRGMRNLQALNLSSNGLHTILDASFQELVQLTDLDLDHNRLRQLSASLLKGPSLQRLSVLENPLQQLTGFTFEGVQHKVEVRVNLTVLSTTADSMTVTWPFRQGAQLYWTLHTRCLPPNSSDSACGAHRSVSPNKVTERVEGLQPGKEYLVCVDPTFLSRLVEVRQCGVVTTLRPSPSTAKPEDLRNRSTGQGLPLRADAGVVWGCVVVVVWNVLWTWAEVWRLTWCRCGGSCRRTGGWIPLVDSAGSGVGVSSVR